MKRGRKPQGGRRRALPTVSLRDVPQTEWDFSEVPDAEAIVCSRWEMARECREIVEDVRKWRASLGLLRGQWAEEASSEGQTYSHLPEIYLAGYFPDPFQSLPAQVRERCAKKTNGLLEYSVDSMTRETVISELAENSARLHSVGAALSFALIALDWSRSDEDMRADFEAILKQRPPGTKPLVATGRRTPLAEAHADLRHLGAWRLKRKYRLRWSDVENLPAPENERAHEPNRRRFISPAAWSQEVQKIEDTRREPLLRIGLGGVKDKSKTTKAGALANFRSWARVVGHLRRRWFPPSRITGS